MAKELPYFQFEPAAYLSGDITICSIEAQGVYINLCCLYWQNDCKLGLSKALRRFKQGLIDELIDEEVIKVVEDQLVINFLDEQRSALLERRERLSAAGRKGGQAKPKPSLSDAKATPKHLEEKRREETKDNIVALLSDEVVCYLNEKLNKSFKATDKVKRMIGARSKDGYKLEDFKKVIDSKYEEWIGKDKMKNYLRPSTLFGTKFDEYHGAVTDKEAEVKSWKERNSKPVGTVNDIF
jgi:uncharacterized phage protein (TIGR02220 family)